MAICYVNANGLLVIKLMVICLEAGRALAPSSTASQEKA